MKCDNYCDHYDALKADNERLRGLLLRVVAAWISDADPRECQALQSEVADALGAAVQPSAALFAPRPVSQESLNAPFGPADGSGDWQGFNERRRTATPPATAWPGPWGLCADGMPHTPRPRSEPMACGRCGNELSADKFFDEAVALKARLAEAEQDIEQWKKVYDLRGRALQRPCINCGYVPQVIRPADSADEVQP